MRRQTKETKKGEMVVETKERYVNPYTDFGFKKLFGTELNKDLLISFLNALFGGEKEITDLTYLNSEQLGDDYVARRAVFDVYCELADGQKLIVEMQGAVEAYFKDRSIYYSTFPIRDQAVKGNWDYRLKDVYTVGILNFVFPNHEYPEDSYIHEVKLKDVEDNHVFYDKLTFFYLEMPKFNKTEEELETMLDKWMFALKNLSRLLERPKALQERIFTRLFEQAEIARFTAQERCEYGESIKNYWDFYSTMKTALDKGYADGREDGYADGREDGYADGREEGRAAGRAEGILNVARNLKQMGLPEDDISAATGLTAEEIVNL